MKKETKTGIYLTIIVHLVALIVILSLQISSMIRKESSFVLDFTQQEELEAAQRREQMRAEISEGLDELISEIQRQSRNVAVDATQRNQLLRDDRHKTRQRYIKKRKNCKTAGCCQKRSGRTGRSGSCGCTEKQRRT